MAWRSERDSVTFGSFPMAEHGTSGFRPPFLLAGWAPYNQSKHTELGWAVPGHRPSPVTQVWHNVGGLVLGMHEADSVRVGAAKVFWRSRCERARIAKLGTPGEAVHTPGGAVHTPGGAEHSHGEALHSRGGGDWACGPVRLLSCSRLAEGFASCSPVAEVGWGIGEQAGDGCVGSYPKPR